MKMVKESGETPIFVGDDNVTSTDAPNNIVFVVTLNEKTKDYSSFLIVKNMKVACVVSSGYGKITVGKPS